MFKYDKSSLQDKGNYQGRQVVGGQQQTSDIMRTRGSINVKNVGVQQQQQQQMTNHLQQAVSNNPSHHKSPHRFQQKHPLKLPTKSPYRPKLIQHLIDSSDEQNNSSFISDDNNQIQFDHQLQQNKQRYVKELREESKWGFCESGYNQDNLGKSNFTNIWTENQQHTALSKVTKGSRTPTDMMINKKPITTIGLNSDSYSSSSLQLTSQTTKKPSQLLQIKYDTLKLNQYNSKQANQSNQFYIKNKKQLQQHLPTTKINITQQLYKSNLFESNNNRENENNILCVDSLEEMKTKEQKKNNFEKKIMCDSVISVEQSYKGKPVSELIIKDQSQIIDDQQDLNFSIEASKIQQLNLQLKRSKDIIKTLTTKNTHLQKTIEMQTVQLQELQSQQSKSFCESKKIQYQETISKMFYQRINRFMRLKVKQLMDDIKNIKMNPLLQQSLQQFMTQLLQIDAYSVNKMVGIQSCSKQKDEEKRQENENRLTKRFSKTVKDNFEQGRSFQKQSEKPFSHKTQNQFRTALQQSNNQQFNSRSNAFMSNPIHSTKNINIKQSTTIKLNLSSNKQNYPPNKQNITPNKKPITADEQFRQLQKSLQKLKNMQKQLKSTSKLTTPAPKKQTTTSSFISKHYHRLQPNDDSYDEQRSSYSLINRRQLSQIINQNSQTVSNLDRSKSRRKKIFAQQ